MLLCTATPVFLRKNFSLQFKQAKRTRSYQFISVRSQCSCLRIAVKKAGGITELICNCKIFSITKIIGITGTYSSNQLKLNALGLIRITQIITNYTVKTAIGYFPSFERRTAAALVAHSTPRGRVETRSIISNLPLE